jgi:hypothetical protein
MGAFLNEFAVNLMPALAVFAVMSLPIFSVFYNQLMDRLAHRSEHTSLYVAIGVAVTLLVGGLFSWKAMLLYLALFALSGMPMIVGEFRRTERRHQQDSKPAPRRRRLPYAANGFIAEAYDNASEIQRLLKLALKSNGNNVATALQLSAMSGEVTGIIKNLLELKQIQNVE